MNAAATGSPGDWLLHTVMPWWRDHVVDAGGGYFEGLDANGAVVTGARRTTLAQARLVYVFSHAAVATGDESMLRAARHGRDFLEARCRDPRTGGWYRAIDAAGAADPVHDAYDHAFVLFALAWLYRATGDESCRALAADTRAFMAARLADPAHGGFREECGAGPRPPPAVRRQNPHMHLLVACLAWHAVDAVGPWLADARAIVDLFERHFFDPATGSLIEYFAPDWSPAAGADGRWREPGHQFEWVWLLDAYGRHEHRPSLDARAEALWQFGTRFGIERDVAPLGLAFDGVDADGTIRADTKLLWPQTEFIKACAVRAEMQGDAGARAAGSAAYETMRRAYFDRDQVRWVNQLTREGRPSQRAAPSRILYHVFLAVAEHDRVIRAAPPG